ncbi:hypothetical protein BH10PSE18_BH10PSE18_22990 [soil metagenome]
MNEDIDTAHPHKINMLIAMTGLALAREADELVRPMFDLVRRFRPESPRIDDFAGWLCLRRGDMLGATRHLTAAVQVLGATAGSARTLLAMVLCARGDPSWLTQAQAVIDEGVDPHGAFLMKSMRGDKDARKVEPLPTPSAPRALPDPVDENGLVAATEADSSATAEAVAPLADSASTAIASHDRRMVFLRG